MNDSLRQQLSEACRRIADGKQLSRQLGGITRRFGLSDSDFALLLAVGGWLKSAAVSSTASEAGLDQQTIASCLGVSAAQVSHLVERGKHRRQLAVDRDGRDRRRQLVRLTVEGQEVVEKVAGYLHDHPDALTVSAPPRRSDSPDVLPAARRIAVLLLSLSCLSGGLGCTRAYWRRQADVEVYATVDRTAVEGNTGAPTFSIEIDPASRMYDPNDPDFPPMPPDDPESHQFMQCVDCMKNSRCWRCAARTPYSENPEWMAYLPRDEEGRLKLDLKAAVLMALLQSPDYQENLEELYLSALDVTFERFRFDTQFFGGSETFFTTRGRDIAGGSAESILDVFPLTPGNRLRATRMTATGAELVIGLANSLVWQFSGPDDYAGTTLIDFAIVQPLLRGAGRTRVLERLTLTERSLLANVRQMERFRRGFYAEISTGRSAGQGPSRRGGVFGGSGLAGFTGVGGGGFGQVGGFIGGFGGGVATVTGGAGAARAGGFIGLLQTKQEIQNQRANVVALRDNVGQLEATYEAGRIDRFQVDLTRQALFNAQSQLLISEADYESGLDQFKRDLGLPPHLDVLIRDPLLDRFTLLSPELTVLQDDVASALSATRLVSLVDPEPLGDDPAGQLSEEEMLARLTAVLDQFGELQTRSQQRLAEAMEDYGRLQQALPKRRESLIRLREREEVRSGRVESAPFEIARLDARGQRLREDLLALDDRLGTTWQAMESLLADPPAEADAMRRAMIDVLTRLSGELLELVLVQASARLDAITLDPIELTWDQALSIASVNRRDWMNSRANLVDSWRLIFFNANDLLSNVDVTFSGDVTNVSDNPFDLRSSAGRLRVGLEFDAPLTRVDERNVYRQAIIEFQQARRSYYEFIDRVNQTLRQELRQTHLNEINFELRREAVHIAIAQVDLTQLRLQQPPQPGVVAQLGDTTARDLVQSLLDLLTVQNDFLSVWVNYEVQRVNLDLDLGTMELDPDGLRVEHEVPFTAFLPPNHCEDGGTQDEAADPAEELRRGTRGGDAGTAGRVAARPGGHVRRSTRMRLRKSAGLTPSLGRC